MIDLHTYAVEQLRLVDPPEGSALGRLLSALTRENDRLRRELKEATQAKWRADDEVADLRRRLNGRR